MSTTDTDIAGWSSKALEQRPHPCGRPGARIADPASSRQRPGRPRLLGSRRLGRRPFTVAAQHITGVVGAGSRDGSSGGESARCPDHQRPTRHGGAPTPR